MLSSAIALSRLGAATKLTRALWPSSSAPVRHLVDPGSAFGSWAPALPKEVRIVEVGPRDGLQNEPNHVETVKKLELIGRLAASGLATVEATAFVSPKWVPQMADHKEVMGHLAAAMEGSSADISFPVLVPNLKGMEAALDAGAREVAIFASASESFSKKNINCTVEDSLERFRPVLSCADSNGIAVRGYVSCVVGCPYEGRVSSESVAALSSRDFTTPG